MSEQTKRCEVLWETTWRHQYHPSEGKGMVRTFRVVAWRFDHEDWKLGVLHYEELTTDAMGETCWLPTDDESVPQIVMGRLLQQGGALDRCEDLSCLI